jgi:hypothetical protein
MGLLDRSGTLGGAAQQKVLIPRFMSAQRTEGAISTQKPTEKSVHRAIAAALADWAAI